MTTNNFWKYFYEIFEETPRQGPGTRESTERALKSIPQLIKEHRILDIGVGTGSQTFDLARSTKAHIIAVDNHPPFIATLAKRFLTHCIPKMKNGSFCSVDRKGGYCSLWFTWQLLIE